MIFDSKSTIEEGDTVVLLLDKKVKKALCLQRDGETETETGTFVHNEIIGSEYGTHIWNRARTARFGVVQLTPELWTEVVDFRTQILYSDDICAIVSYLELRNGSVVLECGTGSGSTTHALAGAVHPLGHVYTFDIEQRRVDLCAEEIERHGLAKTVTCAQRNIGTDGFGMENVANAVVLDVPSPWDHFEAIKKAMKQDCETRVVFFVPSHEQMQRVAAQVEGSFHRVQIIETSSSSFQTKDLGSLLVSYKMRQTRQHTGFLIFCSYVPEAPAANA